MKILASNYLLKHSFETVKKALTLSAVVSLAIATQMSQAHADIDNTAMAYGDYNSTTLYSDPSSASVPVVTTNLHMLVTKVADKTSNVNAGDVITYTYTVTNDGNVTIKNLTLVDVQNAAGPAPVPGSEVLTDNPPTANSTDATANDGVWDSLAPGDKLTFTATHTVKQSDVDNLQ
jgi:large repetitive protein